MEPFSHKVSLKKPEQPQPWTDPVTGEIYPAGKPVDPAEVYTAPTPPAPAPAQQHVQQSNAPTCFCRYCGTAIAAASRFCQSCGASQFAEQQPQQPQQVIINNYNTTNNVGSNNNTVMITSGGKNKWVAFLLCLFLGVIGAHKFYEGKILMGIIYILTGGLFGIGWIIDLIAILLKPTIYHV